MMLVDSPFMDVTSETHDSSHKLFKEAFNEGFPWEVLEVLSGTYGVYINSYSVNESFIYRCSIFSII